MAQVGGRHPDAHDLAKRVSYTRGGPGGFPTLLRLGRVAQGVRSGLTSARGLPRGAGHVHYWKNCQEKVTL